MSDSINKIHSQVEQVVLLEKQVEAASTLSVKPKALALAKAQRVLSVLLIKEVVALRHDVDQLLRERSHG